jgi:predicted house-cleaning NTP pyrophosphatase (Maf/HAM1 superfamily)
MTESKTKKLEARIEELNLKLNIYDDVMNYVQREILEKIQDPTQKETAQNILNQLSSQKVQILRSLSWNQKALQNLQNQQPQTSQ